MEWIKMLRRMEKQSFWLPYWGKEGLNMGKFLLTLISSTSICMTLLINCVTGIPKEILSLYLCPWGIFWLTPVNQSHFLCTVFAEVLLLISCLHMTTCPVSWCLGVYSFIIEIWFPKVIVCPFPLLHQLNVLETLIWISALSRPLTWSRRGDPFTQRSYWASGQASVWLLPSFSAPFLWVSKGFTSTVHVAGPGQY